MTAMYVPQCVKVSLAEHSASLPVLLCAHAHLPPSLRMTFISQNPNPGLRTCCARALSTIKPGAAFGRMILDPWDAAASGPRGGVSGPPLGQASATELRARAPEAGH